MKAEAAKAREGNRTAEALRIYERLVTLRPDWAEGWWYLGTLHYAEDEYPAAKAAFAKVVALEPPNGQAWGLLGISEFKTGEFKPAFEHLTRARAAGLGDNVDLARIVRLHQAILLTQSGRFEEALAILVGFGIEHRESQQVVEAMGAATLRIAEPVDSLSPDMREMTRLFGKAAFLASERKWDESFKLYEQLEARYHGRPNVAYVFGIALLLAKQDPDRAMTYFKAELERDPKHIPAMMSVAFRMLETGQLDQCREYAHKLMELEPNNYAGYYLMGRIHLYSKEIPQAIASLEEAAALAPEMAAIQYALSQAYQRVGRQQDSLKAHERFAQLEAAEKQEQERTPASDGLPATPAGGREAHDPKQGGTDSSNAATGKVPNYDSSSFVRTKLRAEQARESGDLQAAIQAYDQLVKLRPDWDEGWWYLGSLSYDTDQYAAAAAALEKLVALDPQNSQGWGLLGLSEYRLEKHAEAREHLVKSRRLGVDRIPEISRVVRLHLGILFNRGGQFEAALFVLNTFASEHRRADSVLDEMGMAVLRISDPVESLSQDQREMVRKFGTAAYMDAEQNRDESFKLYEQLEAQYRGKPNVAYAFGATLLTQKEPEKAITYFKQELERDPNHEAALLQLALQMIALRRFEEGVGYAQKAIDLAPDNFVAHYALGRCYLYLNDLPKSIASLEKAASLAPTVATVFYTLSQAYQRAHRPEDAAQASAQFEKLQSLNKDRRPDVFITLEDLQSGKAAQPAQPKPQ